MTYVSCDIETYSELDLTEVGVYAYAEHPSTRIYCLAYAIDDGPVRTWVAGDAMPDDLFDAVVGGAELRAWNANFERVMLNSQAGKRFGFPLTAIEQWRCTMVLSAYNGLPKGLDDAAKAVGLRDGKDKEGAKIMRLLCQPKRATKKDPTTEWEPHGAHRGLFEKLYAYCAQDVVVERSIHKRLPRMPQEEIDLYWLDQEINDRGIHVDSPLVNRVCGMIEAKAEDFQKRAIAIAGVSTSQRDEILKWCASRGVYLEGYTKDDVASALKTGSLPPEVREVLEIRRDASRQASGSKFFAAKNYACRDSRVRGMFRFGAAVPTMRWGGVGIQLQNLSNKGYPEAAPADVMQFDLGVIEMLHGDAMQLFGNLTRAMLVPKPGHRFIGCDFSAIEGRVLAWLAGEQWALEVYRTHGKVYEATASQMFGLPFAEFERYKKENGKHHPLRAKGKVCALLCQYGGSTVGMINAGALKEGLTEDELPGLVDTWRKANPATVKSWYDVDRAMMNAVNKPGEVFPAAKCLFKFDGNWLMVKLPSGRVMRYWQPRIEEVDKGWGVKPQITYMGERQLKGTTQRAWCRTDTYGARAVENLTQGLARDCLREALFKLRAAGYGPYTVGHVHDEVILEVPAGFGSVEDVERIMSEPIAWAPGLPLAAAGEEMTRYAK